MALFFGSSKSKIIDGTAMFTSRFFISQTVEESEWVCFLPKTTLTGFTYVPDEQDYYHRNTSNYYVKNSGNYKINANVKYTVIWDSVEYNLSGTSYHTDDDYKACFLGDMNIFFYDNDSLEYEYPFCICYIPAGMQGNDEDIIKYYSTSKEESHTVEIYGQVVKESGYLLNKEILTFAYDSMFDEVVWFADSYLFDLIEGDSYIVTWDGTEYECQAKSMKLLGYYDGIALGNISIHTDVEEENTNEPFTIICAPDMNTVCAIIPDDTNTTHVVSICKK